MLSWLRRSWPLLIVAIALAWQFGAPLVGRVWFFEDIAAYFVPLYTAAARAMRNGDFPVWDARRLGAGSRSSAIRSSGCFYPPNWLWMAVGADAALRVAAAVPCRASAPRACGRWRGRAAARRRRRAGGADAGAAARSWCSSCATPCSWRRRRGCRGCCGRSSAGGAAHDRRRRCAGGRARRSALLARRLVDAGVGRARRRRYARGGDRARAAERRARVALPRRDARRRAARCALALAMVQIAAGDGACAPVAARARDDAGVRVELLVAVVALRGRRCSRRRCTATSRAGPTSARPISGSCAATASASSAGSWRWRRSARRERRGERVALLAPSRSRAALSRAARRSSCLAHVPFYSSLRCPARALYVWTLAAPLLAADGLDALAEPPRARGRHARSSLRAVVLAAVAVELPGHLCAATIPSVHARRRRRAPGRVRLAAPARPPRPRHQRRAPRQRRAQHGPALALRMRPAATHSLPIWRYLQPVVDRQPRRALSARAAQRRSDRPGAVALLVADRRSPQRRAGSSRRAIVRSTARLFARLHRRRRRRRVAQPSTPSRAPSSSTAPSVVADEPPPRGRSPRRRGTRGSAVIVERDVGCAAAGGAARQSRRRGRASLRAGPTARPLRGQARRSRACSSCREPWYPGWQVTVDGKAAQILRVDYALRGVALPPGSHSRRVGAELPAVAARRRRSPWPGAPRRRGAVERSTRAAIAAPVA